jgi:hypothetical protein
MNDPTDQSRQMPTDPAPPMSDEPPPTNRGNAQPQPFVGSPPPVPPPGADSADDLGGLIARMEATLDEIEGAATKLDASSKLFVGQARSFHQEVRLWMQGMEERVSAIEAWKKGFSDDGK